MYGVAKIHLGRAEDAHDCVSEVFKKLLVYRAVGQKTYKPGPAKFSTWLHKVTRNAAKDVLRGRKRRRENDTDSLDNTIISKDGEKTSRHEIVPDLRSKNPRQIYIKKQIIELFKKAKANLKMPYRSIIIARVDDEMEFSDIALKFKLGSVRRAYDLYHYGEKLMKDAMWKEYGRLKQVYKDLIEAKTAEGILSSQTKRLYRKNSFSK